MSTAEATAIIDEEFSRKCDCCGGTDDVTESIKLGGWYCEHCKEDCEDSDNN